MLFSKALFKQSCKANKVMWSIIAFAVCFVLACVMLISGGGKISRVKNGIQDTIISLLPFFKRNKYFFLSEGALPKGCALFGFIVFS